MVETHAEFMLRRTLTRDNLSQAVNGSATMPDPNLDKQQPAPETPRAAPKPEQAAQMEDEEKILAGLADVNMPALLTKDVQGG
jgi:hypothetical protein